jgi:dihydrofolate synthase/folylpolyglutamate synthase
LDASFQDSLDYLYGLQRFGIKLGLGNIQTLLTRLGHPDQAFASVHVAGTNGKGSVCAALAEILRRGGQRTGLYTSPHLQCFNERIRIDDQLIPDREVARLTEEIRGLAEGLAATFFEFTTALALLYFARQQVTWAVLETGMGGRLDATNAVTPRLCVITSLSRDHSAHLGSDLATIAAEKAGIVKPGIPVVCAPQDPEALAVITAVATAREAPLFLCGRDFTGIDRGSFSFPALGLRLTGLTPGLAGAHQQLNMSLALAAAALLRRQGVALPDAALNTGVATVRWPGRLEWWAGARDVLLDGAHNEGGAQALAAYLDGLAVTGVRWVVGIKGDKALEPLFTPLLPRVTALYCTRPPVETAIEPETLAAVAAAAGRAARVFPTPAAALATALADRRAGEIVLVAGSLFLVAAARDYLMDRKKSARDPHAA